MNLLIVTVNIYFITKPYITVKTVYFRQSSLKKAALKIACQPIRNYTRFAFVKIGGHLGFWVLY